MTNEVKAVLISLTLQAIVIFLAWLRLRLKRGNTDADKDKIALRYELITLESYENLKKEHETLAALLPKLETKLERLKEQVQALQGVERERDIALGKVQHIQDIAEKLTVNMRVSNNAHYDIMDNKEESKTQ